MVHLYFCKACVQKSNSRVRVPKQHAPACVAGVGPWGAAVNQQRHRAKSSNVQKGKNAWLNFQKIFIEMSTEKSHSNPIPSA